MNLIIENATPMDILALIDIKNYYIENSEVVFTREKTTESFFTKELNRTPNFYLVAKIEGLVVGYVALLDYRSSGYYITKEVSLYVHKDYGNMGIGNSLLQKMIERAKETNLKSLVAYINSANDKSIFLFEKNGFKKSGELTEIAEKFGNYLSVTILQKVL